MYCAYTIPGMGGNSLMYYYNGKAVSWRGHRTGTLGERGAAGPSILRGAPRWGRGRPAGGLFVRRLVCFLLLFLPFSFCLCALQSAEKFGVNSK